MFDDDITEFLSRAVHSGQGAAELLLGDALISPLWKASAIENEVCFFSETMGWNSELYLTVRNL